MKKWHIESARPAPAFRNRQPTRSIFEFANSIRISARPQDIAWSFDLIGQTVLIDADVDDSIGSLNYADTASSASVLPIFLDLFSEQNEKLIVKNSIITALTHTNKEVRHRAADGIRNYLWQRDPVFAQECITGSVEYARFERDEDNRYIKRQIYNLADDTREVEISKLQAKKDEFRERFKRGELSTDIDLITLRSHSSWHILSPCLMIPNASKESSHIKLWSKMLSILFEAEQQEDRQGSEKVDTTVEWLAVDASQTSLPNSRSLRVVRATID